MLFTNVNIKQDEANTKHRARVACGNRTFTIFERARPAEKGSSVDRCRNFGNYSNSGIALWISPKLDLMVYL